VKIPYFEDIVGAQFNPSILPLCSMEIEILPSRELCDVIVTSY